MEKKLNNFIVYRFGIVMCIIMAIGMLFGSRYTEAKKPPKKYSLVQKGMVTGIKDQGGSGSCWAFAAIKSAESNAIMNGLTTKSSADFSESHLIWYAYHATLDVDSTIYGDGIYDEAFNNSGDALYNVLKYGNSSSMFKTGSEPTVKQYIKGIATLPAVETEAPTVTETPVPIVTATPVPTSTSSVATGGSSINDRKVNTNGYSYKSTTTAYMGGGTAAMAISVFANWSGVANEGNYMYKSDTVRNLIETAKSMCKLGETARYDSVAHLQNANCYDLATVKQLKRDIMQKGAADLSIYYNDSYLKKDGKYRSYYQTKYMKKNATKYANHCVTVVGWDDNYSKNKFKHKPKKNGAWLIANSYGTSSGNNGYFWLSYYDRSITDVYIFEVEPTDNYNNIYQYDGCGFYDYVAFNNRTIYASNVFKANAQAENLSAVSLYTLTEKQKVKISVYKGVNGNTPDSGTLVSESEITTTIAHAGYHTIVLPTSVYLSPSEKFSVVVTYYKNGKGRKTYVPFEGEGFDGESARFLFASNEGESFVKYKNQWLDAKDERLNSAPIKVFTNNVF